MGKDRVFQDGLVGNEDVFRSYAADRGIEFVEEFVGDAGSDLRAVAPAQRVFVSDQSSVRFGNRFGNRVPVERIQAAQVNQFNFHALLALEFLCGLQSARHNCAVGNHGEVGAGMHDLRFPERDHVVRAGIGSASKRFAIQALVLEKQHGIVAADRGAQQSRSVL